MVQNQASIRYTKARWLVNKNSELIMTTESMGVIIALEYFVCMWAHDGDEISESVSPVIDENCDLLQPSLRHQGPRLTSTSTSKSANEKHGLLVRVMEERWGLFHRVQTRHPSHSLFAASISQCRRRGGTNHGPLMGY